ncbi:MAG: flagellar biosynthesis protein FlhB [Spirochaetaceae bacterium]
MSRTVRRNAALWSGWDRDCRNALFLELLLRSTRAGSNTDGGPVSLLESVPPRELSPWDSLSLDSVVTVPGGPGAAAEQREEFGVPLPPRCVRPRNPKGQFALELERFHLQWFAAEDEGRTEEPSEHKIQEAREEGKVAKSQDVTSAVVLLFSVIALWIASEYLYGRMLDMVRFYFASAAEIDITTDTTAYNAFFGFFIPLTLPVIVVAFIAAFLGNVVQVGFLFTTKPITPDFNKAAPKIGKWFERSFASVEALYNFFKSLGKVVIITALAYINIRLRIGQLANLVNLPFHQGFAVVAGATFSLVLQAAIILLILSILDYFWSRRQHLEQLKMTKQEVKEERKQYEGDPQVKSRLRQRMQELLSRNMIQNVPQADVVVTNPTHYAVALQYDAARMQAPTVVAKGADNIAFKIREVAEEHGVPIFENKPLARALFAELEIGDEIPEQYYQALVTILKEVYRMKGKKVVYG